MKSNPPMAIKAKMHFIKHDCCMVILQHIGICELLRNGSPLQYSCLENPINGRRCWAAIHGVAKGRTRLSDFTFTFDFHALEKEMATHSSVLAWRIQSQGQGSLVGCCLWGHTGLDTTEVT